MRACVLALVPIALAQPAFANSHHRHHASHHSSSHHRYSEHRHHHHIVHQRTPGFNSWGQDEGMRQMVPRTFARTDAAESAWQQPFVARRSWNRNAQTQYGWQQDAASQSYQADFSSRYAQLDASTSRTAGFPARSAHGDLDAMIARHAAANGVPAELVRRVVKRESGGNPRARNAGALGLMQIKYATARGVGYTGSAAGLLDAETNLTYAVKYLAGAYHAAGGNQNRAVALYAGGYYGRGVAIARRQPGPAARERTASNWDDQRTEMPFEHVAMRDGDATAVRAHRGYRRR